MSVNARLKYARERAKLTLAQLSARTEIGESSLSEFENGVREPSLSQLNVLAQAYQRSISFFLTDAPIPEEVVLWRQRPSEGCGDIEVRFLRLCDRYHNLEMWMREKVETRLPEAQSNRESYSYADAEGLAKQVRDNLQLGEHPALPLLRVLEEVCGVKVFHLDFEPTGTAACTVSETCGPAILLNSKNARWRRNHDLAHELFHLLTWKVFRSDLGAEGSVSCPSEREEKLATCFARNLLMPSDAIRTAVNDHLKDGKVSFEALYDIARQFDVSVESLLWHMHFVYNRRPEDRSQTESEIERAKALSPGFEEREQIPPPVLPERYKILAIKALRHGEISIGRFAEYLDISRQEAMRYVEQEVTDDEEVQITSA